MLLPEKHRDLISQCCIDVQGLHREHKEYERHKTLAAFGLIIGGVFAIGAFTNRQEICQALGVLGFMIVIGSGLHLLGVRQGKNNRCDKSRSIDAAMERIGVRIYHDGKTARVIKAGSAAWLNPMRGDSFA